MSIYTGRLMSTVALLSLIPMTATVTPYLAFRSQGINGARELVGWQTQINKYDPDSWYGSFSVTPEYTQSFRSSRMTDWLFCDALTDISSTQNHNDSCIRQGIKIQGMQVENRDPQALMAENFYLPTDFSSLITFKPVIDNILVDFNFYVGLDDWLEGLFFRIHSPLCHTQWNLNFCEHILDRGSQNYDVGYFDNSYAPDFSDPLVHGITRDQLLGSFTEYACEGKAITDRDGIHYHGLDHARMNMHRLSKTALAEITAQLGWNFCTGAGYHCGLALRAAAPTGTRPKGKYLFEPIVGNGHHWELGGSLTAHWCSWKSFDETYEVNTYVDINVTHLFTSRQCRTFDLWCNPLSRYMMAIKFTPRVANLKASDLQLDMVPPLAQPPIAQFAKEFIPVANISTIPVDVSAAVQGEFILKVALSHGNYQLDVGYNFWGRTCLNISRICSCHCKTDFIDNLYGLKGDSFVFGFPAVIDNGTLVDVLQPGIPLSASQSDANIFSGCNNWPTGLMIDNEQQPWYTNPGIDNPKNAYSDTNYLATKNINPDNPGAPTYGWNHVYTSANPVLLTFNDLDINRARTRSISNKVFAHFNYIWKEHQCLTPYLGIGGEVEFGQRADCCCASCKGCSKIPTKPCAPNLASCCVKDNQCFDESNAKTISLSQWGIWIKGGLSFN